MKSQNLNLGKTNIKDFYRRYVTLVNPILRLRNRELDVYAALLYYNFKFKDLPVDVRNKIIFNYDTRVELRYSIVNKWGEPLSSESFNNILTSLRKKGIILGNNILNPKYLFIPDSNFSLTFTMLIDE